MDKGKLLDRLGAAGEDRLVLAKILDRAEQARVCRSGWVRGRGAPSASLPAGLAGGRGRGVPESDPVPAGIFPSGV